MATSTIDMACVHPEVSKNTEMPQKSHLSHEMPRPLRVPATLGPNYPYAKAYVSAMLGATSLLVSDITV